MLKINFGRLILKGKKFNYPIRRIQSKWYWLVKIFSTLFFLLLPALLIQCGSSTELAGSVVRWFSAVLLIAQVGSGGVEAINFRHSILSPLKDNYVQKRLVEVAVIVSFVVLALLPGGSNLVQQNGTTYWPHVFALVMSGLLLASAYGYSGAINRTMGNKEYALSRDLLFMPMSFALIFLWPDLFTLWSLVAAFCQWLYGYRLKKDSLQLFNREAANDAIKWPANEALKKEILAGAILGFCGVGFVQVEAIVMGSVFDSRQFVTYNEILRLLTLITMSTVFVGLETRQLLANHLKLLGDSSLRKVSATARLFSRMMLPIGSFLLIVFMGLGWMQNQLFFIAVIGTPQLLLKLLNVYSGPTFPALRLNGYSERAARWLAFELTVLVACLGLLYRFQFPWAYFYGSIMTFAALRIATGIFLCRQAFGRMLWI